MSPAARALMACAVAAATFHGNQSRHTASNMNKPNGDAKKHVCAGPCANALANELNLDQHNHKEQEF